MTKFTGKDGTIVGNSWGDLNIDIPHNSSGSNVKTHCPECRDKRSNKSDKSLSVQTYTGVANCHYCGAKFVLNKDGYIKFEHKEKEYKKPATPKSNDVHDSAIEWFNGRGITAHTLHRLNVTTGKHYMPQVKKEVGTIQFNYYDEAELINVKYRDRDKNFTMVGGAKLIFYNLNALREKTSTILITEGEIDTLSYIEAGFDHVISVPNGASKGSMNLDYLNNSYHMFEDKWRIEHNLPPINRIIIATDNDDAGNNLLAEFLRRFGADRCYLIDLKECNDPNEFLQKHGTKELLDTVERATPAPIKDVVTVMDIRSRINILKQKGLKPGIQVGSERFKYHYSFEQPRMTIVTGISGDGKSEFVDDLTSRLAAFHDWRIAMFSPENFPIELHVSKIVSKIVGKSFNDCNEAELDEVLHFIQDHFFWIYPEDDNYKLENILKISDILVRKYGINALVIDPWTEIDKAGKTSTDDINEQLSLLNRYKRDKNVHIFLVAHPTKMKKTEDGENFTVPTLMDVSGSGNFYNKTDGGLTVYINKVSKRVEVHVNKVKFKHLGRKTIFTQGIELYYDVASGRYDDWSCVELSSFDSSNWLHQVKEEELPYNKEFDVPDSIGYSAASSLY